MATKAGRCAKIVATTPEGDAVKCGVSTTLKRKVNGVAVRLCAEHVTMLEGGRVGARKDGVPARKAAEAHLLATTDGDVVKAATIVGEREPAFRDAVLATMTEAEMITLDQSARKSWLRSNPSASMGLDVAMDTVRDEWIRRVAAHVIITAGADADPRVAVTSDAVLAFRDVEAHRVAHCKLTRTGTLAGKATSGDATTGESFEDGASRATGWDLVDSQSAAGMFRESDAGAAFRVAGFATLTPAEVLWVAHQVLAGEVSGLSTEPARHARATVARFRDQVIIPRMPAYLA